MCQMHEEEGFKFFLDIRNNKALFGPIYSNTIVASNVRLNWFMRFAMEFLVPYLLASNPIFHTI